jgi:hypothetical protein
MPRVRRAVSMFLCAASFLLFCLSLHLWVRSHRVADLLLVRGDDARSHYTLGSSRGQLGGSVTPFPVDLAGDRPGVVYARRRPVPLARRTEYFQDYGTAFGVEWASGRGRSPNPAVIVAAEGSGRALAIPTWWVCALTAIAPAVWVRERVRRLVARSRLARGLCPVCRYDVRGSPGRCPECGTAIPGAATPAPLGGASQRAVEVPGAPNATPAPPPATPPGEHR